MNSIYSFFIPTIKDYKPFRNITIGQFKQVLADSYNNTIFNSGFNLSLINVIEQNCIEKINLSILDKFIIAYQYRYFDIAKNYLNTPLQIREINNINNFSFDENSYKITCSIPNLTDEKNYMEFLLNQKNINTDLFLLAEISLYVYSITLNNKPLNLPFDIAGKVEIIKTIPVNILAKIITYIDKFKAVVESYYKLTDTVALPYDISLLIRH
jgi:hypothetical protein